MEMARRGCCGGCAGEYEPVGSLVGSQVQSTKREPVRIVFDKADRPWFNDVKDHRPGPMDYEVICWSASACCSPPSTQPLLVMHAGVHNLPITSRSVGDRAREA